MNYNNLKGVLKSHFTHGVNYFLDRGPTEKNLTVACENFTDGDYRKYRELILDRLEVLNAKDSEYYETVYELTEDKCVELIKEAFEFVLKDRKEAEKFVKRNESYIKETLDVKMEKPLKDDRGWKRAES